MEMARSRRNGELLHNTYNESGGAGLTCKDGEERMQELMHGCFSHALINIPSQSHQLLHQHADFKRRASARFWVTIIVASTLVGVYMFLPSVLSSMAAVRSWSQYRLQAAAAMAADEKVTRGINEAEEEANDDDDFTLGGLLTNEIDTEKCRSRGLIHRFRRAAQDYKDDKKPSPHLIRKLREYEALHERCGPGTGGYLEAEERLLQRSQDVVRIRSESAAGRQWRKHRIISSREAAAEDDGDAIINDDDDDGECRYVVWVADASGLGNRLISLVSTFLFALLSRRVLLLEPVSDMADLLCEPFPGNTSWLLPHHLSPFMVFNQSSPHTLSRFLQQTGHRRDPDDSREVDQAMRKAEAAAMAASPPSTLAPAFLQLDITHNYDFYHRLFFCEPEQASLRHTPWLFLRSNLYYVPALFLYLPQFREQLELLFPHRDAIFHHLARYLLFPTNPVWRWIRRYYNAYLAKASHVVGIQVRSAGWLVFEPQLTTQVMDCIQTKEILPKLKTNQDKKEKDEDAYDYKEGKSLAVLVTSLQSDFSKHLKEAYLDYGTQSGEVVSVHQPSNEINQALNNHGHNVKAWAEMCLLSFCDTLVTSPVSTFGYVAYGLAGIKPWILMPSAQKNATSPCTYVSSLEPCFHTPPQYDCINNWKADDSKVLPYINQCEDVAWGLKLFPYNHSVVQ